MKNNSFKENDFYECKNHQKHYNAHSNENQSEVIMVNCLATIE